MYSVKIKDSSGSRILYYSSWELAVTVFYNIKNILNINTPAFTFGDRSGFGRGHITYKKDQYFTDVVDKYSVTLNDEILDIEHTAEQIKDILEGLK